MGRSCWEIQVCEFLRWPFGLTSSPSAACWVVQQHTQKMRDNYPLAYKAIFKNMMMDDVLVSVPTEAEAIQLCKQLEACFLESCMTIRKWASNSDTLLAEIPEKDRAESIEFDQLDLDTKLHQLVPIIKTLGMFWPAAENVFTFNFSAPESNDGPMTNRKMLVLFMGLYDPRGLVVPYALEARKIFQESQRETLEWDKPVSANILKRYMKWIAQLPHLKSLRQPRLLTRDYDNAISKTIVIFCDASTTGIGTMGYLRCEYDDGHVDVSLCYAKASIVPKNSPTVPKLELVACMMALDVARLMLIAFDDLTWEDVHVCNDFCTALAWIRQESSNLVRTSVVCSS